MDDSGSERPPDNGGFEQGLEGWLREVAQEVDPDLEDQLGEIEAGAVDAKSMRLSFVETLRASVAEFGGPTGVAREYRATYKSAPISVKAAMLNHIIKGIQDYGEDSAIEDQESIDAIEAEIEEIAKQDLLDSLPEDLRTKVVEHLNQ